MKISPAIPTRTLTIVVMLVRLDPGMVLPPLFREMRLLLGESEFRAPSDCVRWRVAGPNTGVACPWKDSAQVPGSARRPGWSVGCAGHLAPRFVRSLMAWFPRDRGCGGVRAVTNPDTPCRTHFERGAAARKTG